MTISDGDAWHLAGPDGTVYGRLVTPERDMFDVFARFEAAPAFSALAPLFAEAWRRREGLDRGGEEEASAWDAAYAPIAALGLELRPPSGGPPVREFLLHIDPASGEAAFRHLG